MSRSSAQRRRWSPTIFGFVADTYLWIVVCLVLWVALPAMFLGWTPTVITSGSMSPLIQPGDIVLIDTELEPEGYFAPGTILTYGQPDDPNRWTTHRVREITEDGTYVTRGDANRVDDPTAVAPDEVVGAARLVVPLIGLPLQWRAAGEMLPFGVLLALTVIAIWLSTRPVGGPPRPTAPAPVTPEGRVRVRLPRLVPASPYAGLARFSRAVRGPVIGVVALVGLAMSTSVSYTAAAFAAEVASTGNSFSVADDLDPGPDPIGGPHTFVLPGQPDEIVAGQNQPVTATYGFPVTEPLLIDGTVVASLEVRGATPGNPPREIWVELRIDGTTVADAHLAEGYEGFRDMTRAWRTIEVPLSPPLSTVIPAGSTLEVIVTVQRVDLRLGGPSVVTLP
jgi:signal peptidase I